MSTEMHCLVCSNIDPVTFESHQSVMKHFDIDIIYTREDIKHGAWMDRVLQTSTSDVVGFFDSDCVPTNRPVVDFAIEWVTKHKSFIGPAQTSNHIPPFSHIFACPAMHFMYRETWNELGQPSYLENPRSDVAEEVSYVAEAKGKRFKALYPTHWDREPVEGAWRLHNYGIYGIGTHYVGGVYHLYQGRYKQNVDLYAERCKQIVNGTFTTTGMKSALQDYDGRIVP